MKEYKFYLVFNYICAVLTVVVPIVVLIYFSVTTAPYPCDASIKPLIWLIIVCISVLTINLAGDIYEKHSAKEGELKWNRKLLKI